jgi:hypothetical protein
MERFSRAKAVRNFLDRLKRMNIKDTSTVAAVISHCFGAKAGSHEFDMLIHSQLDNLYRLENDVELVALHNEETRETSKKQIRELSKLFRYPDIQGRYVDAKGKIIDPNYNALIYIDDILRDSYLLDESHQKGIAEIISDLNDVHATIVASDLDPRLRSMLARYLGELVILLKNYEVVGFDRAFELASAAMLFLETNAEKLPRGSKGVVVRRLVGALGGALVLLCTLNGVIEEGGKLLFHIKSGASYLEELANESPRFLEDKEDQSLNSVEGNKETQL